jgi:hypothetical protein
VRKEMGRDVPRIVRWLISNLVIMKEMAKHVPDAGSYAPRDKLMLRVSREKLRKASNSPA